MEEMIEIEATVAEPVVEMERRVAELEARVRELMSVSASAAAVSHEAGRKTVKTFAASAQAKGEAIAAGALDAAFASLSVEQRIAVKMEMMRGGMLA